jgi:16S rRNA (cytosine1402-N4)-methyltransferase
MYHLQYSRFDRALADLGWEKLDGALLDLGVSSLQLDADERGFSFLRDGPLDMRMDPGGGAAPASNFVNRASFERLCEVIGKYGEEPMGGRIARAIIDARAERPIETTAELAAIVEQAYPAKWRRTARTHPATRTFQALRMEVNDELGELQSFLDRIFDHMAVGGRVVIISFHSLEDRLVKRTFRDRARDCTCPRHMPICQCEGPVCKVLTKKPVQPSEDEVRANSRSRSAKLRAAERIEGRAA